MKPIYAVALFALALSGCVGYVPGQQTYWDAQVREMCAKDGVTKIFEVVDLPNSQYDLLLNKFGKLAIPLDEPTAGDAPLLRKEHFTYVREVNPSVWRHELIVIRKADKKVLGRQVTYSRIGGDFPSPAHPSSFSCPEKQENLFSAVVKQRQREK